MRMRPPCSPLSRRRNSARNYSPSESPESPVALAGVALALGGLADQLGLLLDLGLDDFFDPRRREVDDRDLGGVVGHEGDAVGRGDAGELKRVVDLHRRDVEDDPVGDLGRQRFDGDLAGDVLEHAAGLDARGVLDALELDRDIGLDRFVELHLLQVEVLDAAPHRVQLLLLDDYRDGFGALDLEIEERRALMQD